MPQSRSGKAKRTFAERYERRNAMFATAAPPTAAPATGWPVAASSEVPLGPQTAERTMVRIELFSMTFT